MINKSNKNLISFREKISDETHFVCSKDYLGTDYEFWEKYDSRGNVIGFRDSKGFVYCEVFDSNNNIVFHCDNDGFKYWNKYDKKNNLIRHKTSIWSKALNAKEYFGNLIYHMKKWIKYFGIKE